MAHSICSIYFMHNDMTSLFSVKNTLKGERTSWFGSTSVVVNISNSYQMEEDKYNAGLAGLMLALMCCGLWALTKEYFP